MNRLLRADLYRMYGKRRFWLFAVVTVIVALMFIYMQYFAMDYVVALDRVIFLPMSFYGIITGALISLFIGDDFSDGVVRNKLIAGRSRASVYLSNLFTGWSACLVLYILILAVTLGMGGFLFENNVSSSELMNFVGLGVFTCLAYGSLFGMFSMLIGDKSTSVMVCMVSAFVFLFICLHTNQAIVQQEYKEGVLNPHFITGVRRGLYEMLHDLNPTGQAAQLSAMECLNPLRWLFCDILWVFVAMTWGCLVFQKKDIK